MASLRVSVSYEMMSKVFLIAKRVNQMGELELGEFREGKVWGFGKLHPFLITDMIL